MHDQPTVTSMPGAGTGADPAGSAPQPGARAAYGYPAAGPPPGEYGYPSAYPAPPAAPGGGYPGYPGYTGAVGWTGQGQPQNGFGITAMVLGIVSIPMFCGWGVLGIILGIMAVIFGILGRKRVGRGVATNGGMALAGIITGAVGILIGAAFLAFMIWAIVQGERSTSDDPWDTSSRGPAVVEVASR
ncbi:DUF4190 domain-containing protein [Streptomyces sp. NPDC091272]|uniref:DUF4190 domain-containing protein n=1 Tax=Streptomyces sp. NPDC091272 TaxID=3365981 RepID=UPI00381A36F2